MSGAVIQGLSRAMWEQPSWNTERVTSLDWITYPILRFVDAPTVTLINVHPGQYMTVIPGDMTVNVLTGNTKAFNEGWLLTGSGEPPSTAVGSADRQRVLRRHGCSHPPGADASGSCPGRPEGGRGQNNPAAPQEAPLPEHTWEGPGNRPFPLFVRSGTMKTVPMARHARRSSTLLVLLAAVASSAPIAGATGTDASGSAATTLLSDTGQATLYVSYTMNCTFTITGDSGQPVTQIAPGSYQITVSTPQVFADVDLAGITDMTACKSFVQFQITGPGVSVSTTLQDGDEDYGVLDATFAPGATYTAVDNNQPSVARSRLHDHGVGLAGRPPNPSGASSPTAGTGSSQSDIVGEDSGSSSASGKSSSRALVDRADAPATVTAAGKVTLSFQGKSVETLKAGRYTVAVTDKSKKSGFVVQEAGQPAISISTGAFTGKRSVPVELLKGQWLFYPSFLGAKKYFLVTS